MQVSRDNLILHLSEYHGDCCPGAKIIVNTDNVEELHREVSAKNYNSNMELRGAYGRIDIPERNGWLPRRAR
jgi:hypothetical protein